jgi:hypothetical protein
LNKRASELDPNTPYDFVKIAEAEQGYPITKILFVLASWLQTIWQLLAIIYGFGSSQQITKL